MYYEDSMNNYEFKRNIISCLLIITMAVIMYFFNIKCPFKLIFKIPCPGCGITRAYICVLRLEFKKAFEFNHVFWAVPILFFLLITEGKQSGKKWINIAVYSVVLFVFIINWIYEVRSLIFCTPICLQ